MPAEPGAPGRAVENFGRIRSVEARAEAGPKASGTIEASPLDTPVEAVPPTVPAGDGAAADSRKAFGQAVAAAARETHEPEPAPASAEPPAPAAGASLADLEPSVSEPAVASDASPVASEAAEQDEATDVSLPDGAPPDSPLPDAASSGEIAQAAPLPDGPAAPVSPSAATPVPPAPAQVEAEAAPSAEVGSPQRRRGPAAAAFAAPRATP
ncbi:hypothetical protein NK718_00005, partial [Alsobacter sp. SYSU M60028]|nr:hypothetical protein [Alsobacter ponti]